MALTTQQVHVELARLDREHARLKRLPAKPERRQAMTTGQREDMAGGLSARTPRAG